MTRYFIQREEKVVPCDERLYNLWRINLDIHEQNKTLDRFEGHRLWKIESLEDKKKYYVVKNPPWFEIRQDDRMIYAVHMTAIDPKHTIDLWAEQRQVQVEHLRSYK